MKKLVIAALAAAAVVTPALAETYAIRAGRLITDAAKPARGASTIIIENGRIKAIEDGHGAVPAGATEIDLSTMTVLPGLIDAHVHLTGEPDDKFWQLATTTPEYATAVGLKNALLTARAGFTTVRDLGSTGMAGHAVRDAVRNGIAPGPRILSSEPALSIVGGHGDVTGFAPKVNAALDDGLTCSGLQECAAKLRVASKAGADVIKITATGGVLSQQGRGLGAHFTDAEMAAIVGAARGLGLKVAAHAHGARGIEAAAKAGVDSIDHGTFADAEAIRAMKANGSWLVPTLMASTGLNDRMGKGIYTSVVEVKARQALAVWGKGLNAAYQAGVNIAFGTDSAVFEHGRNAEEAELMVRLGGMSPRDVVIAATSGAAMLLGVEAETGTLEVGKATDLIAVAGDLIAVAGDPASDPKARLSVGYVMAAGRPVPMR